MRVPGAEKSHDPAPPPPPEEPTRLRLDVAYDGGGFSGWARQPGRRTVQGELEAALGVILGDPPPTLVVAGRTDVGVHATGQVAHVDVGASQLVRLNGRLRLVELARRLGGIAGRSGDLVVRSTAPAPPGFDARFAALWRRYEYRVADLDGVRDPRRRGHTLWHPARLDREAMDAAAASLLGLHDFAAYCRPREGATTIRTLQEFSWSRDDEGVLIARVRADAFCHSMVRALVGACLAVGSGRLDGGRPAAIRDAAVRGSEFAVVPALGLTLVEVGYPPDSELAARVQRTRARRTDGFLE